MLQLLLAAALLSGCAQFVCRMGPLQQELQSLESEFSVVQGNLDRGYAIHTHTERVTEPYTRQETYCQAHNSAGKCTLEGTRTVTDYRTVLRTVEQPVAIDVDASRERVDYLWEQIKSVRGPAEREYQECLAKRG